MSDIFSFDFDSIADLDNRDSNVLSKSWTQLMSVTDQLRDHLQEIFNVLNDSVSSQTLDSSSQAVRANFFESIDERTRCLDTLKQVVTLNLKYINYYEDLKNSKDYDKRKQHAIKSLLQLMVLPLDKIANSPTEAKEIVSQIMRVAYKVVENSQSNNLTRSKDLLDIVFSIVGCGIERYNQSLSFCLKLIQILQYKEQLAPMLADLVAFVVTRHNQRLLIGEILREIDRIDIRELSKDSSCPRAVSTFLVNLSEKCPQEFVPSIKHFFEYLEQDSYIMRNASLSVMGNIIVKHLSHEDSEEKVLRDEILDVIMDHIQDVTGYTRSKALATWGMLSESKCIPLSYMIKVMHKAVLRLKDKSSLVRRSAGKLIVNLIGRNPYANKLILNKFLEALTNEKARLEEYLSRETAPQQEEEVQQAHEATLDGQRLKVEYCQEVVGFTQEIHIAIPQMVSMLTSKAATDIHSAIDFFVTCHEFRIHEAVYGYKRMILLVNSNDKAIQDTVFAAYRKIFFDSSNKSVVATLINFIESSTVAECLSLERLIAQFVTSGDFTDAMRRELWATFTRKKANTTYDESIGAIMLIGMLASSQPDIIQHNLQLCTQYGLTVDKFGEQETRMVRETCIAIRKSLPKKIEDRQKGPMRLGRDDEIFTKLSNILVESITDMDAEHWFSMCDEALRVIFEMAENPDQICEILYRRLSSELLKNTIQCNTVSTQENTNRNESPDFVFQPSATSNGTTISSQNANQNLELAHPIVLARFIHFLGDVALDLTVFLELHVLIELKLRNAIAGGDTSENNKSAHNISVNNISISSRRRSKRFGGNKSVDDQNLEEEIGLAGAEAEDVEMEFIGRICDDEIVTGNNLLAKTSRVIIEVVTDPVRFPNRELKLASASALAKYMMVSVKFCSSHLRLLFTILERTTDNEVKVNLLIAISDLCVRFPNQLDGWTGKIFDCLKSKDRLVRRTALRLISRLVLSDVIKAKEQISYIANLIVDDDPQIAAYSRHFFLELSRKLNAIYNSLPDIISRLSNNASEADFRIVMKFMFELIDKSHHVERLIDKLCTRFMETDNERQWADLAFCLSLLKHSDKTMCKLYDKFDCYKDKLCIDAVFESITSTIANYRKTPQLKNEMKQLLDEFEAKLKQHNSKSSEEEDVSMQADATIVEPMDSEDTTMPTEAVETPEPTVVEAQ